MSAIRNLFYKTITFFAGTCCYHWEHWRWAKGVHTICMLRCKYSKVLLFYISFISFSRKIAACHASPFVDGLMPSCVFKWWSMLSLLRSITFEIQLLVQRYIYIYGESWKAPPQDKGELLFVSLQWVKLFSINNISIVCVLRDWVGCQDWGVRTFNKVNICFMAISHRERERKDRHHRAWMLTSTDCGRSFPFRFVT